MPSDGRFRIVVFGGNIHFPQNRRLVNDLGAWLSAEVLPRYPHIALSPGSDPHCGTKYRTDGDPSVIDVFLIHTAQRSEVEMLRDLHEVYHPFDSKLGWDYNRVFVDKESYCDGHGRAYEGYGVCPDRGAVVVVRPDGYVGLVASLEDGEEGWREVGKYFEGILRAV